MRKALIRIRPKVLGELWRQVGLGFEETGQVLACSKIPISRANPEHVPSVIGAGLLQASVVIGTTVEELSRFKDEGIPQEAVQSYENMAVALATAGAAFVSGAYDKAAGALELFANEVSRTFLASTHPDSLPLERRFSKVRVSADAVARLASLLADSRGDAMFAKYLSELAFLSLDPAHSLEEISMSVLAIDDARILRLLGFRRNDLANVKRINKIASSPAVSTSLNWIMKDPVHAATILAQYALSGALSQLSIALRAITTGLLLGFSTFFSCPNDCTQVGLKQNCKKVGEAVSTGTRTPSDDQKLDLTLTFLKFAPLPPPTSVPGTKIGVPTPTLFDPGDQPARGAAIDGVKLLKKFLNAGRPTIWIQVEYDNCESVRCRIFFKRLTWVHVNSGWVQVTQSPLGLTTPDGTWVPVDQWQKKDVQNDIKTAVQNKVDELCK